MLNQRCSVCLDDIQEPKCLPCLHILCLSCLKKISQQQNRFSEHPIMELLQVAILTCPLCRHKFITQRDSIDGFPSPKICTKCQNYVGQVFEMCCGHNNENVCCDCLLRDDEDRISCPECGKYSTKPTTRRMFLCHVCHKFYPAACKTCPPALKKPASTRELSSYPGVQNRTHRLRYIAFITVFTFVGILCVMTYLELERLSERKFPENTWCCAITVWHVDSWGKVDTNWCSGDDWKMLNAKCTTWPP